MNKLTSSIALCTYNGERYLREQLDSLTRQTRLPDELVVCDDGSTDSTVALLQEYAQSAPFPVRIIQNEKNLGYLHNFEKCSLQCTRDIVFFCDQDDIWESEKIAVFMQEFEENESVALVMSDAALIDEKGLSNHLRLTETMRMDYRRLPQMVKRNPVDFTVKYYITWLGMATAFRKSAADILYPYPENEGHDTWTVRILSAIADARFLSQPLTQYRIHDKNTSGSNIKSNNMGSDLADAQKEAVNEFYLQVSRAMEKAALRLEQSPNHCVHTKAIKRYQNKGVHYYRRFLIHAPNSKRLFGILQELINGNYFKYSRGILSAASDLFQ